LLPVICSLVALTAAPAPADILLSDEFLVDGDLLGSTPSPGPGGVWEVNNQGSMGINAIQIFGGEVILTQDPAVSGEDGHSDFEPRLPTDTTYARFDFRLPASGNADLVNVNEDGNYFVLLRQSGNQGFRARTGVVQPSAGGDFGLAISADSSNLGPDGVTWPTDLLFDTNYRVVISYDAATGGSQLWLDPTDQSSQSISDPVGTASDIIQGFSLRQAGDYQGSQIIDNVVVATTFAEALSGGVVVVDCDFDDMNGCNGTDINLLMAAIADGTNDPNFDLTGDGNVNLDDRDRWLADAGTMNIAAPYLVADFDLDGVVDGLDFIEWNNNKFTSITDWTAGNANGDTVVDGLDFIEWNNNKFTSSDSGLAVVPEPGSCWMIVSGMILFGCHALRRAN
jgi:hypothetical protein